MLNYQAQVDRGRCRSLSLSLPRETKSVTNEKDPLRRSLDGSLPTHGAVPMVSPDTIAHSFSPQTTVSPTSFSSQSSGDDRLNSVSPASPFPVSAELDLSQVRKRPLSASSNSESRRQILRPLATKGGFQLELDQRFISSVQRICSTFSQQSQFELDDVFSRIELLLQDLVKFDDKMKPLMTNILIFNLSNLFNKFLEKNNFMLESTREQIDTFLDNLENYQLDCKFIVDILETTVLKFTRKFLPEDLLIASNVNNFKTLLDYMLEFNSDFSQKILSNVSKKITNSINTIIDGGASSIDFDFLNLVHNYHKSFQELSLDNDSIYNAFVMDLDESLHKFLEKDIPLEFIVLKEQFLIDMLFLKFDLKKMTSEDIVQKIVSDYPKFDRSFILNVITKIDFQLENDRASQYARDKNLHDSFLRQLNLPNFLDVDFDLQSILDRDIELINSINDKYLRRHCVDSYISKLLQDHYVNDQVFGEILDFLNDNLKSVVIDSSCIFQCYKLLLRPTVQVSGLNSNISIIQYMKNYESELYLNYFNEQNMVEYTREDKLTFLRDYAKNLINLISFLPNHFNSPLKNLVQVLFPNAYLDDSHKGKDLIKSFELIESQIDSPELNRVLFSLRLINSDLDNLRFKLTL